MTVLVRRRISLRRGSLVVLGLASLTIMVAGCGSSPPTTLSTTPTTSAATATPIPTAPPTATSAPVPTATTVTDCATAISPTVTPTPNLPLPPHTVSGVPNGAAGAGYSLECTPGATQASIAAFFASALPGAGWRPFDPQTDSTSCGEPNTFWKYLKGDGALGWDFTGSRLPLWQLVVCARDVK